LLEYKNSTMKEGGASAPKHPSLDTLLKHLVPLKSFFFKIDHICDLKRNSMDMKII